MKNQLNTQLKSVLSSEKIVYVFGSGISSALSGCRSSWYQWIADGIEYISDKALATELKDRMESESSAESLISVVGCVIDATKTDSTYASWMKASVESMTVTNASLAQTLSLTRITRDIIATTNYDPLLEAAIGLHSLTYEQPDAAFYMIDKGNANCVLHLHGLYDSSTGVDNIIASQEQYDAIYNDEAAQFIQQLLGTRTLIFIGCGQTTDDLNISRFIKFAGEKLHLDVPYFYVKRSSEAAPMLPSNFTVVDYGPEYDDLPDFLHDMITYRAAEFMNRNPIVGRTIYDVSSADGYGLAEYHFSQETIPFCGRVQELSKLKIFAETDAPVLWWAITGQGGSGKSRLAYEFIHRIEKEYYSFFLRPTVTDADAEAFIPFADSFVVIDYVKGNEQRIATVIKVLIDKYKQTPYKLRLLMLERSNETTTGTWFQNLLGNMSVYDRTQFEKCEYLVDNIIRTHRFLYLDDLEEDAVDELIGNVCLQKGLPQDKGRNTQLRKAYTEKFEQLKYRPLFLQIYIEAWIDNGCRQVSYSGFESLLEATIQKEQERWLNATNNDPSVCEALLSLIIRASITDGLRIAEMPEIYQTAWNCVKASFSTDTLPGIQRKRKISTSVTDAASSLENIDGFINPQYPDIIKEYMFLYYTDEERIADVCAELWENADAQFGTFLGRCLTDFPENTMLLDIIQKATKDVNNNHALRARLSLLQQETVRTLEDGPRMMEIVSSEYKFWSGISWDSGLSVDSKEVILTGLYLSSVRFRGWQQLDESVGAVYILISHAKDLSVSEYCYSLITDRMTTLTDERGYTYSEKIFNKAKIDESQKLSDEWKNVTKLKIFRNHAINLYGLKKKDEALKLSEKIADIADWKDVDQLESYAHTLFSLAKMAYEDIPPNELLTYCDALEDMMIYVFQRSPEYQVNDLIHYYYLHAKYFRIDRVSLSCVLLGDEGMHKYAIDLIDSFINEIESNEMINEFAGIYVGAWALKVAYDESMTDEETERYIERAFDYCNEYADNVFLCEKTIDLVSSAYLEQYKRNPPASVVDRCYALLLRFPSSDDLISVFFHLVEQSKMFVAEWKRRYLHDKNVIAGLISNKRTDIIYSEGLGEPELVTTYVRSHPKVGANEPCPCGSGKKFKKCCRGNGRYD